MDALTVEALKREMVRMCELEAVMTRLLKSNCWLVFEDFDAAGEAQYTCNSCHRSVGYFLRDREGYLVRTHGLLETNPLFHTIHTAEVKLEFFPHDDNCPVLIAWKLVNLRSME